MDVHKPKPIHSWRDFLVEIGTITLGILIALSLESLIELGRNHEVVVKARAELRSELRSNRKTMASVIASANIDRASLQSLIAYGNGRVAHLSKPFPENVNLPGNFGVLSTAAWESTVATQALVHMPFEQADALARVYAGSRAFNSLEERVEARWFDLSALQTDPIKMTDREVADAVRQLRIALSYQSTVAQSGVKVLADCDRALHAI